MCSLHILWRFGGRDIEFPTSISMVHMKKKRVTGRIRLLYVLCMCIMLIGICGVCSAVEVKASEANLSGPRTGKNGDTVYLSLLQQ